MVNCKNCGAPLSLNDAVCPYCGTPNPEAQEHLQKLKELDETLDSAREEVVSEVKKVRRGYSLLVILAVLLLVNLILLPMHIASYEIAGRLVASDMSDAEITAKLDQLLADGEYIEMHYFADRYDLTYTKYRDYMLIATMANYYNRVIENTNDYYYSSDIYGDPLVSISQNIKDFKDEYAYAVKRDLGEDKLVHVRKLNSEFDSYLKVYLKFTDEDIAGIGEMNASDLLVRIKERLTNEE